MDRCSGRQGRRPKLIFGESQTFIKKLRVATTRTKCLQSHEKIFILLINIFKYIDVIIIISIIIP